MVLALREVAATRGAGAAAEVVWRNVRRGEQEKRLPRCHVLLLSFRARAVKEVAEIQAAVEE